MRKMYTIAIIIDAPSMKSGMAGFTTKVLYTPDNGMMYSTEEMAVEEIVKLGNNAMFTVIPVWVKSSSLQQV